jgi:hypothetical protein
VGFAASEARLLGLIARRGDLELSAQYLARTRAAFAEPGQGDVYLVFVNYRRADTAAAAEVIAEALTDRLGPGTVFLDRRAIEIGEVFTASVEAALRRSRVLLALIGPVWATVTDENGCRRLDDPADLVRVEIERADELGLAIVPVFVGRAGPPPWRQLPDSLEVLTYTQPSFLSATPGKEELAALISRVAGLIPSQPR